MGTMDSRPTILVIEDEPEIRRFLRSSLEAEGYRVAESATARRGVIDAGTHKPDIVIVDLGLPDFDGVEVVRQVRHWSTVPILILSARAQERDLYRQELLRTKADFENYVKRMGRERLQIQEAALRGFIKELLPVLDNFDRALARTDSTVEGIRSGILIVRQMLMKAIEDNGIQRIDPLGKPFDPMVHEAIAHDETTEFPPDTVSRAGDAMSRHISTMART